MHDSLGIPACFSSIEKQPDDPAAVSKSGQSVFMSVYQTKLAGHCRLITVTWCKNLLLHGLSVLVQGPDGLDHYQCKVELKPWYFWRKQGSKQFLVDDKRVAVVWDLKTARFNGETEPRSDYYVAIVCEEEVALLLGDLKKDAFRKTGCRPSLIEPILVYRKEHIFGKRKFGTRVKFHEKGPIHNISVEGICNMIHGDHVTSDNNFDGLDPRLEIRVDGKLVVHVKHLQWKFRGNESITVSKTKVEIYWDVHDWLFGSGSRHGLFIFKPVSSLLPSSPNNSSSSSAASPSSSSSRVEKLQGLELAEQGGRYIAGDQSESSSSSSGFCLFLYAWKVE